jgi:hypothetical protein
LNRNYATDWGVGVLTQVGLVNDFNFDENGQISVKDNLVQQPEKNLIDECADACGECYRGSAAFFEKETQSLKIFIEDNKE